MKYKVGDKPSWKPNGNEPYYFVDVNGTISNTYALSTYDSDVKRIALGNCFRTREEAEANKETVKAKLGLEEWVK